MRLAATVCLALVSLAYRFASGQQTSVEDIPALSERVQRSPDDPRANYNLGLAYFRQTQLSNARPYLEKATALSPAAQDAWKALGLMLLGLNDFTSSVVPLQHACELAPA